MNQPYQIIFNDEYILAVAKSPKILVVPTPKNETYTLSNILSEKFQKEQNLKVYPCHRLDRTTSGIILYAKSLEMQRTIMDQFKNHKVQKKYIAFVYGKLKRKGIIKSQVKDKYNPHKQEKLAVTKYKVLKTYPEFCVLEVKTITGRTNQIRIQFSQIGHPLVGERKFAIAKNYNLKFKRPALHAISITFQHPISGENLTLSAPLYPDMKEFLKKRQNQH